jgi:hypothetical protein
VIEFLFSVVRLVAMLHSLVPLVPHGPTIPAPPGLSGGGQTLLVDPRSRVYVYYWSEGTAHSYDTARGWLQLNIPNRGASDNPRLSGLFQLANGDVWAYGERDIYRATSDGAALLLVAHLPNPTNRPNLYITDVAQSERVGGLLVGTSWMEPLARGDLDRLPVHCLGTSASGKTTRYRADLMDWGPRGAWHLRMSLPSELCEVHGLREAGGGGVLALEQENRMLLITPQSKVQWPRFSDRGDWPRNDVAVQQVDTTSQPLVALTRLGVWLESNDGGHRWQRFTTEGLVLSTGGHSPVAFQRSTPTFWQALLGDAVFCSSDVGRRWRVCFEKENPLAIAIVDASGKFAVLTESGVHFLSGGATLR